MIKFLAKIFLPLVIISSVGCSGSEDVDNAAKDLAVVQCASYPVAHDEFMKWETTYENPFGKISSFGQKVTKVLGAIAQTGVEIPPLVLIQLKDEDYRKGLVVGNQIDLNNAVDRLASEVALRHEFITGQCALINAGN